MYQNTCVYMCANSDCRWQYAIFKCAIHFMQFLSVQYTLGLEDMQMSLQIEAMYEL
jgi:hypothetical protein